MLHLKLEALRDHLYEDQILIASPLDVLPLIFINVEVYPRSHSVATLNKPASVSTRSLQASWVVYKLGSVDGRTRLALRRSFQKPLWYV